MNHKIKIAPRYYDDAESGRKPFECRRNDRNYQVGDTLTLQEWLPGVEYTGRETVKTVTYVLHGGVFGIAEGYCVLGLAQGWIPVSERLPEDHESIRMYDDGTMNICSVLVVGRASFGGTPFVKEANRIFVRTTGIEYLDSHAKILDTWHWSNGFAEVTHWMPLPQPPKG